MGRFRQKREPGGNGDPGGAPHVRQPRRQRGLMNRNQAKQLEALGYGPPPAPPKRKRRPPTRYE
jgi:hypothetical protein